MKQELNNNQSEKREKNTCKKKNESTTRSEKCYGNAATIANDNDSVRINTTKKCAESNVQPSKNRKRKKTMKKK